MTIHSSPRRALLLVAAGAGVAACDLAEFIADPKPQFEQTWNLPADSASVSVASLLPPDITILPDSSAFVVSVPGASLSERVGNDCSQCELLNGTNAPKPPFTLEATTATSLPADLASATIVDGQMVVTLTNNMSFDPLRPRSAPGADQGYMTMLIHSGSEVLGRDSVNGADQSFAPGTQLIRTIPFDPVNITGNITVEVVMESPASDTAVFINANGTLNADADIQGLEVASASLNVPDRELDSQGGEQDLSELEEIITDHVIGAEMVMRIANPFAVSGIVNARFVYGPNPSDVITKSFSLPVGTTAERVVALDSAEAASLFGNFVTFELTGGVSSTGPITVTPTQAISMENRLRLIIRTGE